MDALEKLNDELGKELKDMEDAGKIKGEKVLSSPQGNHITIDGKNKIQFASNNYLGLANHPNLKKAHVIFALQKFHMKNHNLFHHKEL